MPLDMQNHCNKVDSESAFQSYWAYLQFLVLTMFDCCVKIHHKAVTLNENPCRNFWHPMLYLANPDNLD